MKVIDSKNVESWVKVRIIVYISERKNLKIVKKVVGLSKQLKNWGFIKKTRNVAQRITRGNLKHVMTGGLNTRYGITENPGFSKIYESELDRNYWLYRRYDNYSAKWNNKTCWENVNWLRRCEGTLSESLTTVNVLAIGSFDETKPTFLRN